MRLKHALLVFPAAGARRLPRRLRTWLAVQFSRGLTFDQSKRLFEHVSLEHRAHLQQRLFERTSGVVQAGAFVGLRLLPHASWDDGDLVPKLLGSYEAELQPLLERVIPAVDAIVDVGCADGYYAVGLARINASATVYAFDSSPKAQALCRENAALNQVESRVTVGGLLDAAHLNALIARHRRPLIFLDCEGCELNLLSLTAVPALAQADFLTECHDIGEGDTESLLRQRLDATHELISIGEAGRDPNTVEWLRSQNSFARWLAVNERRSYAMTWLYGRARTRIDA